MIVAAQNSAGGTALQKGYLNLRLLDGDKFIVSA
jgi:hypothetical protein